jgi:prefoldin subunit 5
MLKIPVTILATIVMLFQGNLFSDELSINQVIVYLEGAEISNEAEIHLLQGKNEITFKGLSPYLDPASVQIAGGGFRVLSVSRGIYTVLDDEAYKDSLQMFDDQISELEKQRRQTQVSLTVLQKEENMLEANRKLVGDGGMAPADLQKALEYFFDRIKNIENQRLIVNEEVLEINHQVKALQQQKRDLRQPEEEVFSSLTFVLQADREAKIPIEVRYGVGQAGWFPSYDIFAADGTLELSYNANIRQQSGTDWKGVDLTVSSASPVKSQSLPRIMPYYLRFGRPTIPGGPLSDLPRAHDLGIRQVSGQVLDATDNAPLPGVSVVVAGTTVGAITDMNGEYRLQLPSDARLLEFRFIGMQSQQQAIHSPVINIKMEPDHVALQEVVVAYGIAEDADMMQTQRAEFSARQRPQAPPSLAVGYQTSFAYEIDLPYDIPSSEEPSLVEIKRIEIPAIMRYQAAPKLEETVFLTAQIPEWEQYNLLDGEANLYIDNQYMGRTILETRTTDDTLSVSLGRDESIIIRRERQREFEQKRFWTNRVREERIWQTAVRNNKNEAITIEVFDQVPISQTSDIKVDVVDISGASINNETGIVNWTLTIGPGETAEVLVRYTVEYPRDRHLIIE